MLVTIPGGPALAATEAAADEAAGPKTFQALIEQILKAGGESLGGQVRALKLLAKENDRSLFAVGLNHVAGRLENQGEYGAAGLIYSFLAGTHGEDSLAYVPQKIHQGATERLAVLRGQGGSFGAQFELLSRNLFQHSLEPGSMFGMLFAGLAFRGGQLKMLRFLLQG